VSDEWLLQLNTQSEIFLNLNKYQKRAVGECFKEPAITLIQGPPGSGKTRVLAVVARLFHEIGASVICLTRTNVAARRMTETMMEYFPPNILGVKVSQEFFYEWHEDQYKRILEDGYKVRDFRRDVICTTMGAASGSMKKQEGPDRDVLLLDEASQIWELEAICFFRELYNFKRVVIFGDEKQLPPYVANEIDTQLSIIDALIAKGRNAPSHTMLGLQYRMPCELGDLVSTLFYNGKLESHKEMDCKYHICVHDVCGRSEHRGTSTFNIEEARRAVELYDEIRALDSYIDSPDKPFVVILTFYDAQRHKIKEMGKSRRVFNVDGFQGQEAPYVILSTAARGSPSGFLCDERRVNVALSRAKEQLHILGCGETLKKDDLWSKIWSSGAPDVGPSYYFS